MILNLIFYSALTIYAILNPGKDQNRGVESITADDLMAIVEFLSSEELEGRLAGSEGYFKAADYAANRFEKLDLKPLDSGGYYQEFNVEFNEIVEPVNFELITARGEEKNFLLGKDYVLRGFTGSGDLSAPVVFCGYGLSLPEQGYDDYKDTDVKDKIVMVFKYNPSWKLNGIDWGSGYPRAKSRTAFEHGALGILLVSKPNDTNPQKPIGSVMSGDGVQLEEFPQLHIDIPVADEFLKENFLTLKDLQTAIDSEKKPRSVELKATANVKVGTHYSPNHGTVNVVGILEGVDPVLKNEYLVIGAHLDHVGKQGNIYFPGANDNASGSAAVIEIAEAFIQNDIKNKRSVIFVLFSSEESGLHGSKYFVDNPPVPLDRITAMINLDCIGFGDSIRVGNGKSAPQLWQIAKGLDKSAIELMVEETWSGGGADAAPFHNEGIPSVYFVTTNSYRYLHLPGDKPETLNRELFEAITKLAFLTAQEIANGNYNKEIVME